MSKEKMNHEIVLTDNGVYIGHHADLAKQIHGILAVVNNIAHDVENIILCEVDLFKKILKRGMIAVQIADNVSHII